MEAKCPNCHQPLMEIPGTTAEGKPFDIRFCRTCNIVHDAKLQDEEWPQDEYSKVYRMSLFDKCVWVLAGVTLIYFTIHVIVSM